MGALKAYAERVSEELGRGGALDEEVLTEARRRLERGAVEAAHGAMVRWYLNSGR